MRLQSGDRRDGETYMLAMKDNKYLDFVCSSASIQHFAGECVSGEGACTRPLTRPSHRFPSSPYGRYFHDVLTLIPLLLLPDTFGGGRLDFVTFSEMNCPTSISSSIMKKTCRHHITLLLLTVVEGLSTILALLLPGNIFSH